MQWSCICKILIYTCGINVHTVIRENYKNFRLMRNDEIFYAKIFLLVILYTANKQKYRYTKISNTKVLQTKLMQITVSGMEYVDITC